MKLPPISNTANITGCSLSWQISIYVGNTLFMFLLMTPHDYEVSSFSGIVPLMNNYKSLTKYQPLKMNLRSILYSTFSISPLKIPTYIPIHIWKYIIPQTRKPMNFSLYMALQTDQINLSITGIYLEVLSYYHRVLCYESSRMGETHFELLMKILNVNLKYSYSWYNYHNMNKLFR